MGRKKKSAPAATLRTDDNPTEPPTYVSQASPLLNLPDELRNRIFEPVCNDTVIQYRRRIGILSRKRRGKKRAAVPEHRVVFDGKPPPPGFIVTCKQIFYGTIQLLYAEATFAFETKVGMRAWLYAVSDQKLRNVKYVVITNPKLGHPDGRFLHVPKGAFSIKTSALPLTFYHFHQHLHQADFVMAPVWKRVHGPARWIKVEPVDFTKHAIQTGNPDPNKKDRLMDLSPELRNRIFEMVCAGTTMRYRRRTGVDNRSRPIKFFDGKPEPPGFVLSCKEIYLNTIQVLYSKATFEFDTLHLMRAWLNAVSEQDLGHVKRLMLNDTARSYGTRIEVPEGALVIEKNRRPLKAFKGNTWCHAAGGQGFKYISPPGDAPEPTRAPKKPRETKMACTGSD